MQHFLQLVSQLCCETNCRKNWACDIPPLQLATQQNVALQVAGKVEQSSTFRNVARQVTTCDMVTATCLAILTQFLMENEFWLARSRGPKSKMASLLTFGEDLDPNKAQFWKLSGPEKVELLGELQQRPSLWKSGGPWTKRQKNDALDELCLKRDEWLCLCSFLCMS